MSLVFDEKKHRYTLDGKNLPSVTTILGKGLPKPGLMYWAANTVAQYALDNPGAEYDAMRRAPWKERDKAAVRGTVVHSYAEKLAHGEEVEVPAEIAGYVHGVVDFLDEYDVKPIAAEARLASATYGYAGTADLFASIDGPTWLLDWKTSKGVHGDYFMQLAAYAQADFMVDRDGFQVPIPKVDRIGVVHLTPTGARLIEGPDIAAAFTAFLKVKAVADIISDVDSWGTK